MGEEYTGPAQFAEFWLQTIRQWESEHHQNVLVALSTTRDVQNQLLSNRELAPVVDVIDMKYWWYTRDGQLYDPPGGQNLAPRQQLREWKGSKSSSAESLARGVRELRLQFPDKAVLCSVPGADPWATLAAGGSFTTLPPTTDRELLRQMVECQPKRLSEHADVLIGELHGPGEKRLSVGKSLITDKVAMQIDPATGQRMPKEPTEKQDTSTLKIIWQAAP